MADRISQDPPPGAAQMCYGGERVLITLRTPPGGTAWLRTNAMGSITRRAESIAAVEDGMPRPGQDWTDIPMHLQADGRWGVSLPLMEPGCFAAKAYWLPDGSTVPHWADGGEDNLRLRVQPAWTASQCSLYTAFVRMFRPQPLFDPETDVLTAMDEAGWTVIPPSGTFRALAQEVPRIVDGMGFRIVLLLPPFPVPTTHARMGRFGSPFAALDYFTVDPACAEHDRRTTPLEQFGELADAIHARGARLFIDVPINHTGWASQLIQRHPEWYARDADGDLVSPGAWGVTWADLVELDYTHGALWREMADVFLYWCRRGVDGFRCDAGYMVPVPVWEYITAKVRREFPDTIFLLEGLGGPIPVTLALLTDGGLDWAYSELFQNNDRAAIDWYLPQAIAHTTAHGLHIHFAETHDNQRLAVRGPVWARMRMALSALASHAGGWGITCGAEWLGAEKLHVHGASPLHIGAEPNLVSEIAALNKLLAEHPAFRGGATVDLITKSEGSGLAMRRIPAAGGQRLLIVANLSADTPAAVKWRTADFIVAGDCLWTGQPVVVQRGTNLCLVNLAPGAVYCLPSPEPVATVPEVEPVDLNGAVIVTLPRDESRAIVWPEGDALAVIASCPFRARLESGEQIAAARDSHGQPDGRHAARFAGARAETLRVDLYEQGNVRHVAITLNQPDDSTTPPGSNSLVDPTPGGVAGAPYPGLISLTPPGSMTECASEHSTLTGLSIRGNSDLHLLLTNGTGAMSHIRAAWGTIRTQYDSLLAANPHASVPVDRRILFTRCRAWVIRRGFSTELTASWITAVHRLSSGHAAWEFHLPCGDGQWIDLTLTVHLVSGGNRVLLYFERRGGTGESADLIVRPDIEDRSFHEKTHLPDDCLAVMSAATGVRGPGFRQPCHHGGLYVEMAGSRFTMQPERLTVAHPQDAARGLGGTSALFSPGYFELALPLHATAILSAALAPHGRDPSAAIPPLPAPVPHSLKDALLQFVVRRDHGSTVIAGYPWFLDWGRDTLIVLRGLIAAGELEISRGILKTFAAFEDRGTLPNMIRGSDCSNRETSDAPLWFCISTADLLRAEQSDSFLDERAGNRSIREIVRSIAGNYVSGTPHGVRMDAVSGLIWSPAHFTWMDTNHPAATEREGYPICIQALWHGTLLLLSRIDPAGDWAALAARVRQSIASLYTRATPEFLSDCLHAGPGIAAAVAIPDDHLRPNQLLAITLGAVTDPALAQRIIAACMELLVPGAIRTLADRPVAFSLPVVRDGKLLNHPHAPFWPHYAGDEDTQRKPAYHNGTAWPWPMPSLAEAILLTGGSPARARAILASTTPLFSTFCLGHLPEIMDGAAPHNPGGCGAQAWSVSEVLRVEKMLPPTRGCAS